MKQNSTAVFVGVVAFALLLLIATDVSAALNNNGIMNDVINKFAASSSTWETEIRKAATWLFWTLVAISMVWTFGFMALRKADVSEFFAEFLRFIMFTGFFFWLLTNGPTMAKAIIKSLSQLGGTASGLSGFSGQYSPTQIIDIGFIMLGKTLANSSIWSPIDSALGIVLGLAVLALTTLIAVNVLLLYITGWILAYGGIFFLGFGGSRWTSDMAINYFKTVLSIAVQIMSMLLIISVGVALINDYVPQMKDGVELSEMTVIAVTVFTIFLLTNKIPQILAGIITGASVGGMGIGQFGAGAMMGAAAAAGAAAAMTGSMISSGAMEAAGGVSALKAAFAAANGGGDAGGGYGEIGGELASAFSGAEGGSDTDSEGGSNTPFAQAAGFSTQPAPQAAESAEGGSTGSADSEITTGPGSESPSTPETESNSNTANAETTKPKGVLATLAQGAGSVVKQSLNERLKETAGGRIAAAINEAASANQDPPDNPESNDDTEVDVDAEIAAFVGTETGNS